VLIGALFAAADTALTSLSATRLEALVDQARGPTKAALVRIQRADTLLRSRYLLGRIASSAVATLCGYEALAPVAGSRAPWVSLLVTILVMGVTFEITTTLARKHADQAAPAFVRWLWPLEMLMLPIAVPLGWLGAAVGRKKIEGHADLRVTEAEVEALVDEGERSGLFASEPAEMIRNVLELVDRTARDVMVPRTKVEAIEVTMPLKDVRRMVSESGHSRYPVYRNELDNIVGLLYAKDLFSVAQPCDAVGPPHAKLVTRVEDLVRAPANFVAGSQPLSSLLREMRSRRQHLAIVVDELGSVSGIVTLEDVLEEIVGEIRDEHDTDETGIEELSDGRLVADARVTIRDLGAFLGSSLVADHEDQSLGLMLTQDAGKVPEVGEAFSKFGLQFVVRDRDDKHIGKVEITRC
jgi:CBS domain containing-hemolysin-like protein